MNGTTRTYNLFVPNHGPTVPMPLLIAVHGGGGNCISFPQQAECENLAEVEALSLVRQSNLSDFESVQYSESPDTLLLAKRICVSGFVT